MLYAGNKTAVLNRGPSLRCAVCLSIGGKAADRKNGGSALPLAQRWEGFRIA